MKFNVNIPTTVELDDKDMQEITIAFLEKEYDIKRNMQIKDGSLIIKKHYPSQGGWDNEEVVRKATPKDKAILEILKELAL